MDLKPLVKLIKQIPQLWDRNRPTFRNKEAKELAWKELSLKYGQPVNVCKEHFKSLREKYLREREKINTNDQKNSQWDLFDELQFLDPHILTRTVNSWNSTSISEDEASSLASADSDPSTDFDRQLIVMVKKSSPIWDRNSNTYPNKTSKHQLWQQVSTKCNRDVNTCMLRWKALREKYIRQKAKFQEGEAKWELLDDLSFLDKVIQYRRKQSEQLLDPYGGHNNKNYHHLDNSNYSFYESNSYIRCNDVDSNDYVYTDSSNEFLNIVKEETTVQQMADSSYRSCSPSPRKRVKESSDAAYDEDTSMMSLKTKAEDPASLTPSSNEVKVGIKENNAAIDKTPEQLFGDLVASLLSKKPENQRNLYMIEIMTALAK